METRETSTAKRWFSIAILTQMYMGNFESVFEQQLSSINGLLDAQGFLSWVENEIASCLTGDYYRATLPNELEKNKASGPAWNGFLAAQVVMGSRALFGTGTIAQLLLPASSGTKKTYDKQHLFPSNFFEGWFLCPCERRQSELRACRLPKEYLHQR